MDLGEKLDLGLRKVEYPKHLEESFIRQVVQPWFSRSGLLSRMDAMMDTASELGSAWLVGLLFYSFRAFQRTTTITNLIAMFGVTVALGIMTEQEPDWGVVCEYVDPDQDIETLLDTYHVQSEPIDDAGASMALRAVVNLHRSYFYG